MFIARTYQPECQYKGMRIVDAADWLNHPNPQKREINNFGGQRWQSKWKKRDVFMLLAQGYSLKAISEEFFISCNNRKALFSFGDNKWYSAAYFKQIALAQPFYAR